MCLGIPGRIISITGATAVIDVAGARKTVSIALLDGAAVDEYVIVHAGFAIERIDTVKAEETLRLIDEVAVKR
ncbi:MAG: hydrogenase assembly protein HypC [Deltaproteobacteria bacterium RIFCSPLOWO2_02_FULL_53_8]|nr:MAG: hydrogenase assembly protein HypC [Deltaproteobacteria bacterium RIFCSPLOWO2_02_FULL_53_8]